MGDEESLGGLDSSQLNQWNTILHPHDDRLTRLDVGDPRQIRIAEEVIAGADAALNLTAPSVSHGKGEETHAYLYSWNAKAKTQINTTAQTYLNKYWAELRPQLDHLSGKDLEKIQFGLKIAYFAHDGQMRKSGEPFIIHPVAVAGLLAGLKMDVDTVLAGLLHDTVEDTQLTFLQIELLFGKDVRRIVEGETKVSKLPKIAQITPQSVTASNAEAEEEAEERQQRLMNEQAENLRQMFIAMSEDFRIIIVKLADRLHNMRTLAHMPPHKQVKISRETLDIFAPLAHRLGIWQFKSELEDKAFMYIYPNQYKLLKDRLGQQGAKFKDSLESSKLALEKVLDNDAMLREQQVDCQVTGRMKELYALFVKMQTRNQSPLIDGGLNLETLNDVVALRVVLEIPQRPGEPQEDWKTRGVWLCYHVLGLVQHLPEGQPVPSQVKDYISFPKPNGYQSLHTSIIRNGQTVEVQIRTNWMHSIAEYGMAAHWLYKDQKYGDAGAMRMFNKYQVAWMTTIKEWQDEIHNSQEFVETIRRELLGKRVFVFLRDGKILNLSRGATVIDAAFAIHTEVGLTMQEAQINGHSAPLSYELQNGDVVSIITSSNSRPSLDWMRFARSRSTRAKLRGYFRTQQRTALVQKGWLYVHDFLQQHRALIYRHLGYMPDDQRLMQLMARQMKTRQTNLNYSSLSKSPTSAKETERIADDFCMDLAKIKSYQAIQATISQLLALRFDQVEASGAAHEALLKLTKLPDSQKDKMQRLAAVSEEEELLKVDIQDIEEDAIELAPQAVMATINNVCPCCSPVYGEPIEGTCSAQGTLTIHRAGCPELRKVPSTPASIPNVDIMRVAAVWGTKNEGEDYTTELQVLCKDRKFLLRDVSDVMALEADISSTSSETMNEVAVLHYKVKVEDIQQLRTLTSAIRQIAGVMSVERVWM